MDLPWLRDEIAARISDEPSSTSFFNGHHQRINNILDSARGVNVDVPGTYQTIHEGPHPKKACLISAFIVANPFPVPAPTPIFQPFRPTGVLDVGGGTFTRSTVRNVLDFDSVWQQCEIDEAGWRGGRRLGENDWVTGSPDLKPLHPIRVMVGAQIRAKFNDWRPAGAAAPGLRIIPRLNDVDAAYGNNNVLRDTEDFTGSAWELVQGGVTIDSNDAIAPDGTLTMDKLTQIDSVSDSMRQTIFLDLATNYWISVYMKAGTATTSQIVFFDRDGLTNQGIVNVAWDVNGVPTPSFGGGTVNELTTILVSNDIYRISFQSVSGPNSRHSINYHPERILTDTLSAFFWGVKVEKVGLSRYKPLSETTGPAGGNGYYYNAVAVDPTFLDLPGGAGDHASTLDTHGPEELLNPSFDTDTVWVKGTGWTISGGSASCDGTQTGQSNLTNNSFGPGDLVDGAFYRCEFTITGYVAGNIRPLVGGTGVGIGTFVSGDGVHVEVLQKPTGGSQRYDLQADADFIGNITVTSMRVLGPLNITGDLDLQCKVALDDWTLATDQAILTQWTTAGNQRGWLLFVGGTGLLRFGSTTDGFNGTSITISSTVALGLSDGATKWVRAAFDADNGAGGFDVTFYTSDNGLDWVQLGDVVTTAGVREIFDSTAPVNVSGYNDGITIPLSGKAFVARIFDGIDGIDGTLVYDARFENALSGELSFVENASGLTVTINNNALLAGGLMGDVEPIWPVGNNGDTIIDGGVTWELQGLYRIAGIRIEPAVTNSILQSRNFDTAPWVLFGPPIVTQDEVGIDGVANTAWKIEDDSDIGVEWVHQDFTIPDDTTTYLASAFVKKEDDESFFPAVQLLLQGGSTTLLRSAQLNRRTGEIIDETGASAGTVLVQDIGDWWRVTIRITNNATGNVSARVALIPARTITPGVIQGPALGTTIFDQVDFIIDAGLRERPFTPVFTTTVAVTRARDILVYGPTASDIEGTAVADCIMDDWADGNESQRVIGAFTSEAVLTLSSPTNTAAYFDGNSAVAFVNRPASGSSPMRAASRWNTILDEIQIAAESIIDDGVGTINTRGVVPLDDNLIIGGREGAVNLNVFPGAIDNVRIYDVDLGEQAITDPLGRFDLSI